MYPRDLPVSKLVAGWQPKLDLSGTTLADLTAALATLLQEQQDQANGFTVPIHTVTIDAKLARIRASLHTQRTLFPLNPRQPSPTRSLPQAGQNVNWW